CTSWLLGSALFALMSAAQAAVDPAVMDRPAPTPIRASKIVLVGDSTTAVQGGWGPAFCARHVTPFLTCTNLARGGRSTYNYRAEGSWALAEAEMRMPGYAQTWVLIQFGHNDAKFEDPTRYTDPAVAYPQFLMRYVQLARDKGATPVLITPVARLLYDFGSLLDTHGVYTQAVKALATRE
ncbi:GDSL-type esterase/lipase family protein, partial [Leclercia adecarboxylata]|uniref:GDSL-type esterase/lipase family protein n=1 Tax=Leclercia adecarboxylata TaxID=83655 RepID=UPI00234CFF6F